VTVLTRAMNGHVDGRISVGPRVKLRLRRMVLKIVVTTTARCYELILYAGGSARRANCANRIDGGVRAPSSMCLQSLRFIAVVECKRSALESSGSSLIEVEATMLDCRGGRESALHLIIAEN
jgi:hypothetical protein